MTTLDAATQRTSSRPIRRSGASSRPPRPWNSGPRPARHSSRCSARSCSSSSPVPRRGPFTGGSSRCWAVRRSRPSAVLAANPETLRAAGLSANKLAAIIDLAAKFVDGTVPTDDLDGLSDDEIVARLVTRSRCRALDGRDVPALPAPPSRRLAGGRPRCAQRLGTDPRDGGAADPEGARRSSVTSSARTGAPPPGTAGARSRRCPVVVVPAPAAAPAVKAAGRRPPSRPKKA